MPRVIGRENGHQEERRERLAVNIFDLTRVHPTVRALLLGGKLDLANPVSVDERRIDESAVRFTCPLLEAAAACDVLRSEARKVGDPPPRVYVRRQTMWSRVPATALLTAVEDGRVVLHPAVFPPEANTAEWRPLPITKVF